MSTRSIDEPAPTSSQAPTLYLVLVVGLVGAVLVALIGGIVLAALGRAMPPELIALASVCAGGLVGLLAPSPLRS